MNLIIHRGSHEIGGSCVEVIHGDTRMVIDIGMPLLKPNGEKFDMRTYKKLSGPELVTAGVLPNIAGFYQWDTDSKPVDALLVSHAHFDHYGFASYKREDIRFHLGEGTLRLIGMSAIFMGHNCNVKHFDLITSGSSFQVGSITITPYIMDHSAFDAYAFLLEADGERIYYSGDFREHGWKKGVLERMLKIVPQGIDALLLEGTMIGRDGLQKSEDDIESEFFELFKKSDNLVMVAVSGQNIDRLVSIFKAALKSGRLFVIDPYIATVLDRLSELSKKLPHPSRQFKTVKVYFPTKFCKRLERNGKADLFIKFGKYKIRREEISANPEKVVILVRPSVLDYLELIENIDGATVVWSQWEGYLKESSNKAFIEFIEKRNMKLTSIHTSGHAPVATMKKLCNGLKPKLIIPIHTNHPKQYQELFADIPVAAISDGVEFSIQQFI